MLFRSIIKSWEVIASIVVIGILAVVVTDQYRKIGTNKQATRLVDTAEAAEPKENPAGKICPLPSAPKADPCDQYRLDAKYYLVEAEKIKNGPNNMADPYYWKSYASASAMYSSYYLVCRDLERRDAEAQKKKAPKCP